MVATRGVTVTAATAAALLVAMGTGCAQAPPKRAGRSASVPTSSSAAAPAEQMTGAYKVTTGDPESASETWEFTSCGDGCAQVDFADRTSSEHAVARYVKIQWTLNIHRQAAIQCGDGSVGPGTAHYSWNPDTLKGRYWASADASVCGNSEPFETDPVPLRLEKIR